MMQAGNGMKTHAWVARALAVVVAVVVCAQGAQAQSTAARGGTPRYSFQTIHNPFGTPGEDITVQALWMNNRGTAVAQYQIPPDPDWFASMHGAVLQRGAWTNVDVEGALSTAAVPNSRGRLLVDYRLPDEPGRVAIRDRRGLHLLPDLPEYPGGLIGNGINDLAQMAAVAIDAAGAWHGFVGDIEDYEVVDYPGAVTTVPMWLNNRGVAVGYHFLADGSGHGFRYARGKFVAIDRPEAGATFPNAINNQGEIVGVYTTATGEWRGFLLERGRCSDVVFPGAAAMTGLYSINDRGQIAGTYLDAAGINHGFVATPAHGK
jgi:hypothetical protein